MEQFEQLLTCAICLDRYRNPKLLPCQHSFCMEPCMDGLVDYVRRQVKCPECRAEHRIPYQGVQGYPTNVTLQRFLELHIEITGEMPDPTSGQIMKRCAVCTEKAYCMYCNHCTKDVCPQCKSAHMDILRREISRINNQVRRAVHRLEDILATVEKNIQSLQVNCSSVAEEVDEIYRRLSKALKDRTDYLRAEIDRYLSVELRNLGTLKENLELEVTNIQANCDLADKHMQSEDVEWEDNELLDTKEIFLKTVDFIRNFEAEMGDYTRRVRFSMTHDPNQLVMHVSTYGDLNISMPHQFAMNAQQMQPGGLGLTARERLIIRRETSGCDPGLLGALGPGLMRSKSDHRLAAQYRQQDRDFERDERAVSPLNGRRFGDKYPPRRQERGDYDYAGDYEESRPARSRIRSRFRHGGDNTDSDNDTNTSSRNVRFTEGQKERERVLDTEDVAKGPLSGITRLYDSPRVMKRLQDSEIKKDQPPAPPPQQPPPASKFQPPKRPTPPVAQRQVSEEDEIAKIKKLMKNAPGEPRESCAALGADRVATLRREEERERSSPAGASTRSSPATPTTTEPIPPKSSQPSVAASSSEESDDSPPASLSQRKPSVTRQGSAQTGSRRSSASSDVSASAPAGQTKGPRSNSSDSAASIDSIPRTGAAFTTEEVKQMLARHSQPSGSGAGANIANANSVQSQHSSSTGTGGEATSPSTVKQMSDTSETRGTADTSSPAQQPKPEPPRFHSRFLRGGSRGIASTATKEATHEEEDEEEETSSSEEESSSDSSDSDEGATKTPEIAKTDIGPLLARSAQARKTSKDETTYTPPASRYGENSYKPSSTSTGSGYGSSLASRQEEPAQPSWRSRSIAPSSNANVEDDSSNRSYGGFTSRFLNKSKSSAAVSPEEEDPGLSRRFSTTGQSASSSANQTPKSRYAALKDRKSRLARSKSTHNIGVDDDDEEDVVAANSPAAYLASKFGSDLSRSRSSHAIKSREPSPDRSTGVSSLGSGAGGSSAGVGEKDGAALSSWARYLKNKYGARGKEGAGTSTISNSRRLSLGLPLRPENDEDQKNSPASPTSPTQHPLHQGFAVGSSTRGQYAAKRRQVFSVGSRGSEPGYFTWPRGVATGPDNSIVVADSSNHRVQVFDSNGIFQKEFGTYGNGEGEFDCLAGIAVNRIGQFIIADRYNHRIQVMDPSGRFLRAFGSQGTSDGKFNYPWGITTDALGFIYVCDKENHRVQVFQSDGTFVGKFGSHGSKVGQLDHPHYIAVSNTNKVIVSDSNNHRVQVFDVNGRVLSSFGSEGSEEGQFKFPRGDASRSPAPSQRPYSRSLSGPASTSTTRISPSSDRSSASTSSEAYQPNRPTLARSLSLAGPRPATSSSQTQDHTMSSTRPNNSSIASFGSSSGRSGIHPGGGLGEQPNPDFHSRGGTYPGLRLLGERGGGVQGIGGRSRHVQFQHPCLRSGKPSCPSVLRSSPVATNVHVFDAVASKKIMMEATMRLPPYRSSTLPTSVGYSPSITAALIAQRRMSLS